MQFSSEKVMSSTVCVIQHQGCNYRFFCSVFLNLHHQITIILFQMLYRVLWFILSYENKWFPSDHWILNTSNCISKVSIMVISARPPNPPNHHHQWEAYRWQNVCKRRVGNLLLIHILLVKNGDLSKPCLYRVFYCYQQWSLQSLLSFRCVSGQTFSGLSRNDRLGWGQTSGWAT